jgi:hypothetical protein
VQDLSVKREELARIEAYFDTAFLLTVKAETGVKNVFLHIQLDETWQRNVGGARATVAELLDLINHDLNLTSGKIPQWIVRWPRPSILHRSYKAVQPLQLRN